MRCLRDAPRRFQAAGESACGGPARKASGPRLHRREVGGDARVGGRTGGWSPRSSPPGRARSGWRCGACRSPTATRRRRPRTVPSFATLGLVPSCNAMPRATQAAAASSKAASRSADPARTPPRRTTNVVTSLKASALDSGGSMAQVRSVTATDSRRWPLSALRGSQHDRRARRPSSGTRRGARSPRHAATAAPSARAPRTREQEEGGPSCVERTPLCRFPARGFSISEAAVVIFFPASPPSPWASC